VCGRGCGPRRPDGEHAHAEQDHDDAEPCEAAAEGYAAVGIR
jgi:hypothetical protein